MRLITAHRILIGAAIAFFAFYAVLQMRRWLPTGEVGAAVQAIVAVVIVAALVRYYRTLSKKYPGLARRSPSPPGTWNARS